MTRTPAVSSFLLVLAGAVWAGEPPAGGGGGAIAPAPAPKTNINLGLGATAEGGAAWRPLAPVERWSLYRKTMIANPMRYGRSLAWTFRDEAEDKPEGWNFSQRLSSRLARSSVNSSVEHSLAAVAGYDPRYVRCACPGVWKRVRHALAYEFITLDRKGGRVFNWPHFAGVYSSEFAAAAWTPGVKWSAGGVQSAHEQIVGSALFNIVREFLPDLKKKLKK